MVNSKIYPGFGQQLIFTEHVLRERAGKTTDITSFHPLYFNRHEDRNRWPEILHQYRPTDEDFNKPPAPEWVLDDGRVVIDCINHIMYDYPTLPKTIASSVPGWLLAAFMRSNLNIHMQDIRGRIIDDAPAPRNKDDLLGHNKLGMRISRFRKLSGCLLWSKLAQKNDPLQEYMDGILPKRCLEANSTKNFRDLFPHEVKEIGLKVVGRSIARTRTRTHARARKQQLRMRNMTAENFDSNGLIKAKRAKRKPEKEPQDEPTQHDNGSGNEESNKEPVFKKSEPEASIDTNHAPVHQTESPDEGGHQAPDPPLHTDQNPISVLSITPQSDKIKDFVFLLLTPTCHHYSAITEQYPPKGNEDLSYDDQVSEMQQALADWHVGNRKFGEPLELVRLKFFNDKIAVWNFPWIEDLFGPRLVLTCTERQSDGVEWF
ncbi:MAG: hypothetical protein Q9167_002160 [Letrouitia subvulpina]